jgi:hypothetical protein
MANRLKQYVVICCCCGKQLVRWCEPLPSDPHITTAKGARAGFNIREPFCGHCARDLGENGCFPDELVNCCADGEVEGECNGR